jgi:hypothetical protein
MINRQVPRAELWATFIFSRDARGIKLLCSDDTISVRPLLIPFCMCRASHDDQFASYNATRQKKTNDITKNFNKGAMRGLAG